MTQRMTQSQKLERPALSSPKLQLLEESASTVAALNDPRGAPFDPISGYSLYGASTVCSRCGLPTTEAALLPTNERICPDCLAEDPPRRCLVPITRAAFCNRKASHSTYLCSAHSDAARTLMAARARFSPLKTSLRSAFSTPELTLLATLYTADHGAPVPFSTLHAPSLEIGNPLVVAYDLNLRLSLAPNVPLILTSTHGYLRLNPRWLTDAAIDLPALLTHPFSLMVLMDSRPIRDRRAGIYRAPVSHTDLLAAYLREHLTVAERAFLDLMRQMGIDSEFQPQVRVSNYIADFLHCGLRVDGQVIRPFIVEIDGSAHDSSSARARDRVRDKRLRALGYDVYRFSNTDVLDSHASVARAIVVIREERRI